MDEAVHEDGDRRDVDAAESADRAGLGHARGEIAGKERRLVGREHLAEDVGDRRIVGEVDDRELLVGIGLRRRLGGVAEQEADGDDDVAILGEERIDVGDVVGLGLRFEQLALDAEAGLLGVVTPFQAVWLKPLSSTPPVSVTWQAVNAAADVVMPAMAPVATSAATAVVINM